MNQLDNKISDNSIDKKNNNKYNKKDKWIAAFVLHALGDTIGFRNGDWEFNYFEESLDLNMTSVILYDFIYLGGINGIDLKGWYVSDDTIINLAVAKGILQNKDSNYEFNENMVHDIEQELIIAFNNMGDDDNNNKSRYYGVTTLKYIKLLSDTGKDGRTEPYDNKSGGNGAAMRAGPIGMAFYKNPKILIDAAINLSRITHNSVYGYLAGLVMALFVSYAIADIPIEKWIFLMLDTIESKKVKKYIRKNVDEEDDYERFIGFWQKYIDTRFDKHNKPIVLRSMKNIVYRTRYYHENFVVGTAATLIGESGFCAMIMAYDALLDCDGKWEKLIIYACLHVGDSDTVGSIAGFLYGLVYGWGDVPESNLKYLEFKDELEKIGTEFYDQFS